MKRLIIGIALIVLCGVGQVEGAVVILDWSPLETGAVLEPTVGDWSNISTAQNWGEQIQFTNGAQITEMDIFSRNLWGSVGDSVTIRVWNDMNSAPGSLLFEFTETISIIDSDAAGTDTRINRKHVDFTSPVNLAAATPYWIGMSGTSTEIALAGLIGPNAPDDEHMFLFDGTTLVDDTSRHAGDMAFRLYGTQNVIPEPSTLLILCMGVFVLLVFKRRK